MGSPYQSDSMRRARDVCRGICNRMILHFSYYCKYGVLFFGDDKTGPADESKRTKQFRDGLVKLWEGAFIIFAILLLCEITTSFV